MSLLAFTTSLRVPGRLCADPTNLALAFPHGGTDLGLVRAIRFRPGFLSERLPFEEFGGKIGETVHGGQTPRLGVVLLGFTDAMSQRVFPETFVGATLAKRGIRSTSATLAGRLGSASTFKLLFSPRHTADHPGLILYAASAIVEEIEEVPLNTEEGVGLAVVFEALKDSANRDWEFQRLADMTL